MNEKKLKITVVHTTDGYGLVKDAQILVRALNQLGHDAKPLRVDFYAPRRGGVFGKTLRVALFKFNFVFFIKYWHRLRKSSPEYLTIHLENIAPDALLKRGKHVLIPNQEWFKPTGLPLLQYMDAVWCKSEIASNIFSEFGVETRLIKFVSSLSDDRQLRVAPKQNAFLSRIGNSGLRGLEQLVSCWGKHPDWPSLYIVIPKKRQIHPCPDNVVYVDEFAETKEYINFAASFKFQIFTTQAEGFGHSIFEAINLGSVVLVTDAPPMNEWLSTSEALLIGARYNGQHRLSPLFLVTEDQLISSVQKALELDDKQLNDFRNNGYQLLEAMGEEFDEKLKLAIEDLA